MTKLRAVILLDHPRCALLTDVSVRGCTVVYGGSFNPPHMGHQMACLYLLEALEAAAVWLVPSYSHPFGKAMADFEQRLAMCRLLAAPFAERVVVSSVERELGGRGRTLDTLNHLGARHPEQRFALAVGADILREVGQWHRWDEISAGWPVVVLGREGYDDTRAEPLALPAVSSTMVRERIARGEGAAGYVPAAVHAFIQRERLYGVT